MGGWLDCFTCLHHIDVWLGVEREHGEGRERRFGGILSKETSLIVVAPRSGVLSYIGVRWQGCCDTITGSVCFEEYRLV